MSSKILFLGTAGDSMVMGKQNRATGGIALQAGGLNFLINPGPGSLVRAKQYQLNLREVDIVIVTENTLLSANDVNAVIDGMTNGGLDTKGVLACHPSVLEGTTKAYPAVSPLHKNYVEKIITLRPQNKIALNSVEIIPVEIKGDGYGLIVNTEGSSIGYTSNTGFSKAVAEEYAGCDVIVICVPNVSKKSDTKLNIDDAIKFIDIAKPRLCVVTNFGTKLLETDLLSSIRLIQRETKVETIAAKEGLIIDPKSYAASEKQRRLLY